MCRHNISYRWTSNYILQHVLENVPARSNISGATDQSRNLEKVAGKILHLNSFKNLCIDFYGCLHLHTSYVYKKEEHCMWLVKLYKAVNTDVVTCSAGIFLDGKKGDCLSHQVFLMLIVWRICSWKIDVLLLISLSLFHWSVWGINNVSYIVFVYLLLLWSKPDESLCLCH